MSLKSPWVAAMTIGVAMLSVGCGSSQRETPLPESTAAEFQQQLQRPGLVLAKFGAPWCPPCREVDRELAKLAASGDRLAEIITINVDDEPGLAKEYQISSIPRIMLFDNGSKVKDHVGYAGLDEIQSWIRAAAKDAEPSEVQWNPLVAEPDAI